MTPPIARRVLTLGPDHEPLWVRLYVQRIAGRWAAMICGDDVPLPAAGETKGTVLFGDTADEAERQAKAYLGLSEPAN